MKYQYDLMKSQSMWAVLFLALLLGTLKFTHLQHNILSYDYFGLYLYLPATFIYGDPGISDLSWLEQINAQYGNTPMFYQLEPHEGYNIIRFFSGMAIMLSPFFLLGHALAGLSGYPADGFSFPYQLAMTFAAWFYVLVGLVFLRKVLLRFVNDKATSISLLALYLGTNLFFWTTFDAGAPHTILFTLYTMLLWFTIRWHESPKPAYAAMVGLLLGLIIVSRPSEIVAVFIPLLWNVFSRQSLIEKGRMVLRYYPHIIYLIAFAVLAGLPQMLYFKAYTGQIYFSTYNDPQSVMHWWNPDFSRVLFSFRKGWFIYAPLMVFAVAGFILLYRKGKNAFGAIGLHFVANLYLIAAFSSLISYGWRAFIQSYALLAVPLAFVVVFFYEGKAVRKSVGAILLVFFIMLSVFQSWQLMNGIIHGSRMTKEYYFAVFGKTRIADEDNKLLRIDHNMDAPDFKLIDTSAYKSYVLSSLDFSAVFQYHEQFQIPDYNDTTKLVYRINHEMPFTPGVKVPFHQITNKEHFWARMSFAIKAEEEALPDDLKLVATFTYQGSKQKLKGKTYKYRAIIIEPEGFNSGQWRTYQFDYLSPEVTTPDDRFETYLWSPTAKTFLVRHFEVKIFEPLE